MRSPSHFRHLLAVRNFSAEAPLPPVPPADDDFFSTPVVDSFLPVESVDMVASTGAASATGNLADVNFAIGGVMNFIDSIHTMAGIPYWEAILATTLVVRIAMLPVALKTIQGSARMAVMRPEMEKVTNRMKADPRVDDAAVKKKYEMEMKALFAKFKVNPFRALMWPFVQFPVFMGMFLALRDMGTYFPDLATGGAFWFADLTLADPFYVLPALNALSFLAMIELGSDGMNAAQQGKFKWIMRGVAVIILPVTASFNSGLLVYWVANNSISLVQTAVLKNKGLRALLEIPDPPKDQPPMKNPFKNIAELLEKERSMGEGAPAERLDIPKAPDADAKPAEYNDIQSKTDGVFFDKRKKKE